LFGRGVHINSKYKKLFPSTLVYSLKEVLKKVDEEKPELFILKNDQGNLCSITLQIYILYTF